MSDMFGSESGFNPVFGAERSAPAPTSEFYVTEIECGAQITVDDVDGLIEAVKAGKKIIGRITADTVEETMDVLAGCISANSTYTTIEFTFYFLSSLGTQFIANYLFFKIVNGAVSSFSDLITHDIR